MDCAPLFVVNAEDLGAAMLWVSFVAFFWGLGGVAFGYLCDGVLRVLRIRRARRPFAERAARVERMRERSFLAWDRIAARNAREAARATVQ